jgi:HK97 gp10 family phage protein
MADIELNWMGEELERKLMELGDVGDKIEAKAVKKAAKPILEALKKETLNIYDQGDLHKSMKVSKARQTNTGRRVWVGDVSRKAIHGWYIEYGTKDMPANPFMDRCFQLKKGEARAILIREVRKGLGL